MESREPAPQPPAPDRGGVPRTLIAFVWATLIVVLAVVMLVFTNEAWAVVFAVGLLLLLIVVLLAMFALDIGRGGISRRSRP